MIKIEKILEENVKINNLIKCLECVYSLEF